MPAWSFSAIDGFNTCPRKFHAERVAKVVKEVKSPVTDYGTEAHKAFEKYLFKGKELPLDLRHHQPMLDKFKDAPGKGFPEQKLALTVDFKPTGFFDSDVWCRAIIDYAKVNGDRGIIIDWKFGKMKEGFDQIRLCSAVLMHHMPELNSIVGGYYWAKDKKFLKTNIYRTDIGGVWNDFLPRVKRLELAYSNNDWPARPSGLCRKYCQVTACEHCGK
jgi:hypothetical protein